MTKNIYVYANEDMSFEMKISYTFVLLNLSKSYKWIRGQRTDHFIQNDFYSFYFMKC